MKDDLWERLARWLDASMATGVTFEVALDKDEMGELCWVTYQELNQLLVPGAAHMSHVELFGRRPRRLRRYLEGEKSGEIWLVEK